MKKNMRKLVGCLLCIFMMISMFPTAAFADGAINVHAKVSLEVTLPSSGTEVKLYRVADMAESSEMTLSGDFVKYPVSLEHKDQAGWGALAEALSAYTAKDNLKPLSASTSDDSGKVAFRNLSVGLYLVVIDKITSENEVFMAKPFLVALPSLNDNKVWYYDVSATAKYEKETIADIRVHKVWNDSTNTGKRPPSINVELLKDGNVFDTVILNPDNGWSYEWKNLSTSSTWQVIEEAVPADYTVSVVKEGKTYLLTNTLKPDIPPDEPPDTPRIPYTGMLWWPVPVLAALGLVLILAGMLIKRKSNYYE